MQSEQRNGPGLGERDEQDGGCTNQCCLRETGVQENMGGEELPIPRSGSGGETTKVSLTSCLSVGQASKPLRRQACFILRSNISSFYYENCIHTYRTIAYLQIFLHTKKAPKPQGLSITDFFANTISLVKSVFLLFSLHFYHNMFPDSPNNSSATPLYTFKCIPVSVL